MNSNAAPPSRLLRFYYRYLQKPCAATFIQSVAGHYTVGTLMRIAGDGDVAKRRAAILSLGFLAGYEANFVLGRALKDPDRAVRLLAEDALRSVWMRDGNDRQQLELQRIFRLNRSGQHRQAAMRSDDLIFEAPWYAEAWHQRSVARFALDDFAGALEDASRTLELNPFHWVAAVGAGHCHLAMDDLRSALECYRQALHIHSDLDQVRMHADCVERALNG